MWKLLLIITVGCCHGHKGRQRVVNIYTGRNGKGFSIQGQGFDTNGETNSEKTCKILDARITNLTEYSTKLKRDVDAVRADWLAKELGIEVLRQDIAKNTYDVSRLKLLKNGAGQGHDLAEFYARVDALEKLTREGKTREAALTKEVRLEKVRSLRRRSVVRRLMTVLDNLQRGLRVEKAARLRNERAYVKNMNTNSGGTPATGQLVAVSAHRLQETTVKKFATLVFGVLTINEGNAYDTITGVFTTPVSGLYSIHVTVLAASTERVHFAVMVDGDMKLSLDGVKNPGVVQTVVTGGLVMLSKNSRVYVLAAAGAMVKEHSQFNCYLIKGSLQSTP